MEVTCGGADGTLVNTAGPCSALHAVAGTVTHTDKLLNPQSTAPANPIIAIIRVTVTGKRTELNKEADVEAQRMYREVCLHASSSCSISIQTHKG